jgi:methanol--5-hydroxybenzimidazolylcobamide Co-methyltransferase
MKFTELAIDNENDIVFGKALHPVQTRRGLTIGDGTVYPELNFTLPPMQVTDDTIADIEKMYMQITVEACQKAIDFELGGLVIELETLIEMTLNPDYAIRLTDTINKTLEEFDRNHGLKSALRVTPNDTRDKVRPPFMRSGELLDDMFKAFAGCADAGADLLSIESTGGKEIHDEALLSCDIEKVIFALGIMGTRDMAFLWQQITAIAASRGIISAGDTACGFGNTAMTLAEKKFIPRVFAAVVRAVSIVRSLVAYEYGAVGPGKDCGYENAFLKAITGYPMSLEGHTAACAHSSPLGNIAAATCDLWSNESVQAIKLLGGLAPIVSLEQLIYDCRLMNEATRSGHALIYRDLLVNSDKALDPQALIMTPANILRLSKVVVQSDGYYQQAKNVALEAVTIIDAAYKAQEVAIAPIEQGWLAMLPSQIAALPDSEEAFIEQTLPKLDSSKFRRAEYQL